MKSLLKINEHQFTFEADIEQELYTILNNLIKSNNLKHFITLLFNKSLFKTITIEQPNIVYDKIIQIKYNNLLVENSELIINNDKYTVKSYLVEKQYFIITNTHLKLINNLYTNWLNVNFNSPCIDTMRPFGSNNPVKDIINILGLPENTIYEFIYPIYREIETALQISFNSLKFERGIFKYVSDNKWTKINKTDFYDKK